MTLPFAHAPQSLCLLRLSAIGDICHTLPVLRTIQKTWPQTRLCWVIGRTEYQLIGDIPGIEFLVFDKAQPYKSYWNLKKQLSRRKFDALLHMQMSIRSSLINRFVNTKVRLGFDRARAKDMQWLFNNFSIPPHQNQHVMDSLFGFTEALGIKERYICWDIPIDKTHSEAVDALLDHTDKPVFVISPCSSMPYRNWHAKGYAAVADYAAQQYGAQIVISGGPTQLEQDLSRQIQDLSHRDPINLTARTNLKQLLALLKKATAVLSPDSGPAHMATAVRTRVIGLYACTNPDRARPYLSQDTVINKYPEAIQAKFGKPVEQLPWGTRVRDEGTMDLITVDEVISKVDLIFDNRSSGQN